MSERAYLLALLRDDRIVGYTVMSDPSPTLTGSGRWAILAEFAAETYHAASEDAHRLAFDLRRVAERLHEAADWTESEPHRMTAAKANGLRSDLRELELALHKLDTARSAREAAETTARHGP